MVDKIGYQLIHPNTEYPTLITDWLENNKGGYLEIGVYYGIFLSKVAETYPERQMYAIDPYISDGWTGEEEGTHLQEIKQAFLHNTRTLSNILFWNKTTKQCEQDCNYNEIKDISCILVDGSHHYDNIVVDVDFISKIKLEHDTLVCFDDSHIQDVQNGIEYFNKLMGVRIKKTISGQCFILAKNS